MAVAAVIHEGCLKRRLDPRHFRQIDIAAYLFFMFGLEIEFFNAISTNNDYARLLFVRGVDKHFVCHVSCAPRRSLVIYENRPAAGTGLSSFSKGVPEMKCSARRM